MADSFLCPGVVPGILRHHDLVEDQSGNSLVLRNTPPAFRVALCHLAPIPVLLAEKEDFNLEQKKATHRVAS